MTEMSLEGHLGRGVAIDICATCQAIWFDGYESLQLSAASVLKLFRLIWRQRRQGEGAALGHGALPAVRGPLRTTHDLQRTTRFEYRACPPPARPSDFVLQLPAGRRTSSGR
jgi:hypothetical protein